MYHYRWAYEADINKAGHLLPLNSDLQLGSETWTKTTDFIVNREIERRAIVASLVGWVQRLDDLSGMPDPSVDDWATAGTIPETTMSLLAEIGRSYVPFMIANAAALESGADEMVCEILGTEYRQAPFKYQGKCPDWLHEEYTALSDAARSTVDGLLAGTGCEMLFTRSSARRCAMAC